MTHAAAAARRFPFVLLSAAVAAGAALLLVVRPEEADVWLRLMASAALGLPLFLRIGLATEGRRLTGARAWLLPVLLALIPLAFFWRSGIWTETGAGLRFVHLFGSVTLGLAASTYVGRRETIGCWHFNWLLVLRFLLGAACTGVTLAGLAASLAGLAAVLGADVTFATCLRVLLGPAIIFLTWFVLAGIPRDFDALDRMDHYPAGIRVCAVALVLLTCLLYVVFAAYSVRVLVLAEWPEGHIGFLVSALATAGVASLVLIQPARLGPGSSAWIERYARWFWIAILPAVGMLLAAVSQRLAQYGVTEARFMLTTLALWLGGAALYSIARRPRVLVWIPYSLSLLGPVTLVGPWPTAYESARRSQSARLEAVLSQHGALQDGRIVRAAGEVPDDGRQQIRSIFSYLIDAHGASATDRWFDGGTASLAKEGDLPLAGRGRDAALLTDRLLERLGLAAASSPQ